MSMGITVALLILTLVSLLLSVIDFVRGHRGRAVTGLILLVVFVIVLNLTTDFPRIGEKISFGEGISVGWTIVIMSIGVIFGIIAQYVWSKPEAFSWFDFLRPVVVSPLILLPLVGSLGENSIELVQIVSLVLLAFQNGFFWQQVLKDAVPKTK